MSLYDDILKAIAAVGQPPGRGRAGWDPGPSGGAPSASHRLPASLRTRLKSQATRRARNEFAPKLDYIHSQEDALRHQLHQTIRSDRGAIDYAQQAINQEPLKGLHGRYKQEVGQEIAATSADVAAGLPALIHGDRQAYRTDKAAIDAKLLEARGQVATEAQSLLADKLAHAHKVQHRALASAGLGQNARQNQHAKSQDYRQAMIVAQNLQAQAAAPPWDPKTIKAFGSEDSYWAAFQDKLLGSEGVTSPHIAQEVTQEIRTRTEAEHAGTIADLFAGKIAQPLGPIAGMLVKRLLTGG